MSSLRLLADMQRRELQRRVVEDDANPEDVVPWERVRAQTLSRLKPNGGQIMTAENFDRVLGGLRQMQPFRVFTVELHGGRRFEVDHPCALVVRDGVAVFIAPGGAPIWFDHESVNQIIGSLTNESS
jgi:hypothetical protein